MTDSTLPPTVDANQVTRESVERFVDYFRRRIGEISSIESPSRQLYDKLLYMSVLDALSKSVFPRRRSRDRLVSFVKQFSKWEDSQRVSLPHLVRLLKKAPDPAFERLRLFAVDSFTQWQVHNGMLTPISADPDIEDIKRLWPGGQEYKFPLEDISLESLQHSNLFYTLRNSLVHELRPLGHGMDFDRQSTPYYHRLSQVGDTLNDVLLSIELVYPSQFLNALCTQCLDAFQLYFSSNSLDPYDYYTFGTYWIEELNE